MFAVLSWSECEGMRPAFNHKSFGPFDTKEKAKAFLEQQLKPRHDVLDDAYEQQEIDEQEKMDSQAHDGTKYMIPPSLCVTLFYFVNFLFQCCWVFDFICPLYDLVLKIQQRIHSRSDGFDIFKCLLERTNKF